MTESTSHKKVAIESNDFPTDNIEAIRDGGKRRRTEGVRDINDWNKHKKAQQLTKEPVFPSS